MTDPRPAVIAKRLTSVGRILMFCSSKGGVGKSFCTVLSGLALAAAGRRVCILDLDLQGASAHLFLGITPRLPQEDRGILPVPVAAGLSLVSAASFTGERPFPLRGPEVSDAILELLAVTVWEGLDFLLIDMPPGIGDEVLDLARILPRSQALVVTTPSPVSLSVVERLLSALADLRVPVLGILANMADGDERGAAALAARHGDLRLSAVPWEPSIEQAIGDLAALRESRPGAAVASALRTLGCL